MSRRLSHITRLGAAVAVVAILLSGLDATPTGAEATEARLADVRRATARYHSVGAALADGFVATEECVAHPTLGGMGFHYVHPERAGDAIVVPTEPEALLYVRQGNGVLRLAGVEWVSPDPDQDLATDAGRPVVFGQPFDGPMPGHEPGMPIHFDLHAWIWQHNPSGTFSPWNPAVTCG